VEFGAGEGKQEIRLDRRMTWGKAVESDLGVWGRAERDIVPVREGGGTETC